jgi:hypothetical protein
MNPSIDSFDEVKRMLNQVRQQTKTKQKFPQEIWDRIISLVNSHSIQEVSSRLNISQSYLRHKIRSNAPIEFKEISFPQICSDFISIEISSNRGITAKINGPASCLGYLTPLLRG